MAVQKNFSQDLTATIHNFLDEDGWEYFFDEEKDIFRFSVYTKDTFREITCLLFVGPDEFSVCGTYPFKVDINNKETVAALLRNIGLSNCWFRNGCLSLNFAIQRIQYNCFVDCDNVTPSREMLRNCIRTVVAGFEIAEEEDIFDILTNGASEESEKMLQLSTALIQIIFEKSINGETGCPEECEEESEEPEL